MSTSEAAPMTTNEDSNGVACFCMERRLVPTKVHVAPAVAAKRLPISNRFPSAVVSPEIAMKKHPRAMMIEETSQERLWRSFRTNCANKPLNSGGVPMNIMVAIVTPALRTPMYIEVCAIARATAQERRVGIGNRVHLEMIRPLWDTMRITASPIAPIASLMAPTASGEMDSGRKDAKVPYVPQKTPASSTWEAPIVLVCMTDSLQLYRGRCQ
ncbi:MAG: hypothetical protein A2101_02110 [Spirochaetes bacterium GWF2_52_7]|nr:MAG: hypothetical protein A2101_02110 [Spirochaetes bacterium GWF2_52_7]